MSTDTMAAWLAWGSNKYHWILTYSHIYRQGLLSTLFRGDAFCNGHSQCRDPVDG